MRKTIHYHLASVYIIILELLVASFIIIFIILLYYLLLFVIILLLNYWWKEKKEEGCKGTIIVIVPTMFWCAPQIALVNARGGGVTCSLVLWPTSYTMTGQGSSDGGTWGRETSAQRAREPNIRRSFSLARKSRVVKTFCRAFQEKGNNRHCKLYKEWLRTFIQNLLNIVT